MVVISWLLAVINFFELLSYYVKNDLKFLTSRRLSMCWLCTWERSHIQNIWRLIS